MREVIPFVLLCALSTACGDPPVEADPDMGADDVSYSMFDLRQMPTNNAADAADSPDQPEGTLDLGPGRDLSSGEDLSAADIGMLVPGMDSDGDGLEDVWEASFASADLDWERADSDGDGTGDDAEDYDGDGLTNRVEFQISRRTAASGNAPDPFRRDLLVELDEMSGRTLSDAVLADAAATFAALQTPVGLLVYRDEGQIAPFDFDGSFAQRHMFFEAHGPTYGANPAPLPVGEMIHVAVVTRRSDDSLRGGEVVTDGEGNRERTGVLVFYDALAALHPQCGLNGNPPDITLDDALASALAHELGHALQLGHETSTGGGLNYFNVMSVPTTCTEAQQRFHGLGNGDPALGATAAAGASRFSAAAEALMRFDERLSVDTATLANDGAGFSM